MKKNYRFTISYDGSRYFGWEHQPNTELTIQGQLEKALLKLVGENVEILGAGRTDAGVHALEMTAHARLATNLSELEIRNEMNRNLPEDIRIREVKIASGNFHSRYNALGKTYCYTCYTGDSNPVFAWKYVHVLEKKPNLEEMRKAAKYLIGTHDFASFCSNAKLKKSTVRLVDKIEIIEEGDFIKFYYHGTGFLQHMVRILTGTLLEVGLGERATDSIPELIEAKSRPLAGFTAPAKGLCMVRVDYH